MWDQPSIPVEDPRIVECVDRIGFYDVLKPLGRGEFAEVFLCQRVKPEVKTEEEESVALKAISKAKIEASSDVRRRLRSVKRINLEIEAMKALNHPNICQLHDAMHTRANVYLVMELGGIDLYDALSKKPRGFGDDATLQIGFALASALEHCNTRRIAHRDIKPENVLVQREDAEMLSGDVKLCDFGLCGRASDDDGDDAWIMSDFVGSPGFFAPEILCNDRYNARKVDVWSLGCVVLEMVLGHEAFEVQWLRACYDNKLLYDSAEFVRVLRDAVARVIKATQSTVRSLLEHVLVVTPEDRISAIDLPRAGLFGGAAAAASLPEDDGISDDGERIPSLFSAHRLTIDIKEDDEDSILEVGRRLAIHTTPCAKNARKGMYVPADAAHSNHHTRSGENAEAARSSRLSFASELSTHLPSCKTTKDNNYVVTSPTQPASQPKTRRITLPPTIKIAVDSPVSVMATAPFSPIEKPTIVSWSLPDPKKPTNVTKAS